MTRHSHAKNELNDYGQGIFCWCCGKCVWEMEAGFRKCIYYHGKLDHGKPNTPILNNFQFVQVTAAIFLTPSALSSPGGGLFSAVQAQLEGSSTFYLDGFETALKLISVAISLTVGLSVALFLVHPKPISKSEGVVFSI